MSSVVINLHMLTGPALSPPKIVFTKKRFGYSGGLVWGRRGKTGGGAEKLRHREPKRTASKFALPNTDWWDFMIERLT
jgi:hypothetical protein